MSIPTCHAGDRGSIPRRGGFLFVICVKKNNLTFKDFEKVVVYIIHLQIDCKVFISIPGQDTFVCLYEYKLKTVFSHEIHFFIKTSVLLVLFCY